MSRFAENKQLYGLGAAFALVAGAFLLSALVTRWSAAGIDADLAEMQTNSLPSVTHLTRAHAEVRKMREAFDSLTTQTDSVRVHVDAWTALAQGRERLDAELDAAKATPDYVGEHDLWEDTLYPALERLDATLTQDHPGPYDAELAQQGRRDLDALDDAVTALVDLNHDHGYVHAEHILDVRERSAHLALWLEGASAVFAALAAALALRAAHRFQRLMKHNADLQSQRADELESFARRVAHDLLNPLSAVTFGLGSVAQRHPDDATMSIVRRALRSLDRARQMVHGIFSFSRSGAKPEPGARARLGASVRAAAEDLLSSEGPVPPRVEIEPFEDCDVACDETVLGVVLSNLLGNADKYTRGLPERRIVIRASASEMRARVEVEDTGHGIAPELAETIFQPYFRAPGVVQPGLGLGLATVKRILVAHGGAVGVTRGKIGTLFWFELPRVRGEVAVDGKGEVARSQAEATLTH